jgi:hypothetical protein
MSKTKLFLTLFAVLLAGAAFAASNQWVHVHIENPSNQEKVRMNIPIALMETMMPLIEEKGMERGMIHLHDKDMSVRELRSMWKQVRAAGDNEFLSVENRDGSFHVYTKDGYLMVKPDKESRKHVEVQIPLAVVDAMLSGEGEELNLSAAVKALKDSGVHDIITVKDEDKTVHVWIDESNQVK